MMTATTITSAKSVQAIMQIAIAPSIMAWFMGGMAIAPFDRLFLVLVVLSPLSRTHPHHPAAADEHQHGKRDE